MSFARRLVVPAAIAAAFLSAAPQAFAAGDAARGLQIFRGTCGVCHLARNDMSTNDAATKIGPNLYGVMGRKSGMVPHFRYSAAMHSAGIVWNQDLVAKYANDPQKFIPNVRMAFPGLHNPQQAADVAAYLATLK